MPSAAYETGRVVRDGRFDAPHPIPLVVDPVPGPTAPPAPDETPWVFRHRVWIIGAAFLLAAFGSAYLSRVVQVPFAQWMSLDPRLRIGNNRAPLDGAPVLEVLAPTLLILAGMAIRAWGTSYLRGHVMLDKRLHTDRLIIAGPFRWCRNPLYLGNMLLAAGYGLYLPAPGLLLATLAMGIAVGSIANAEAKALRKTYGAQYEAYEKAVPMFIPKPPAKTLLRGTPVEPDWRNGILTEMWQVLLAAYLACIALRQGKLAVVLVAIAFVGMTWMRWRNNRSRVADAASPKA